MGRAMERIHYRDIQQFGPLVFVPGEGGGKFPGINLLYLEEGDERTVVDPGGSPHVLRQLQRDGVGQVILSHYHTDHMRYLDWFDRSEVSLHVSEVEYMASLEGLARAHQLAGGRWEQAWREGVVKERGLLSRKIERPYRDGDVIKACGIHIQMVHAPGHSPGHTCLWFKEVEAIYIGDIDLTRFGPWYGNATSDLDDFIASIAKVRQVETRRYITAHEAGVVDRETFLEKLQKFETKIYEREERILGMLERPLGVEELVAQHPIYRRQFQPHALFDSMERWMIRNHLQRLVRLGGVAEEEGLFRRI